MKRLWVGVLVVVMAHGAQIARATCDNGRPTWTVDLWENSNAQGEGQGNRISYRVYLNASGEYELAVSYMDWWNTRISSLDTTWDTTPWSLYSSDECGSALQSGNGDKADLGSSNDLTQSLKFSCPSDRGSTSLDFFENTSYGGACHPLTLYKLGNGDNKELVIKMNQYGGWWNDKITVIDVGVINNPTPRHYYWYFYKDADFNGNKVIVSDGDDTRNLTNHPMNDDITSFRLVITDSETAPDLTVEVPTMSEWGMVALALLLLASGTGIIMRRSKTTNLSS